MLSAGLSGAVNGFWAVEDADQGKGVMSFREKGSVWKTRRALAKDFWSEPA
jgi:enoyl-CoA hydratase